MDPQSEPPSPPDSVEEAIFHTASDLSDPVARAAFLNRACGDDAALRGRIEELLRASGRADSYFQNEVPSLGRPPKPEAPGYSAADPIQITGARIGRYKLLQQIGEGGMGVVYMAEQEQPVRRRVALKIIKLGMDTASVVARFEAERQALALMDHPNIARIFDGGMTENGRPYFVMELVQGVAITEYCDKNHLDISARIELFLKVCDAVQSAHMKGIIHLDLKPSNIMVTLHDGVPVPKVIDFGVAKAMNQELTAKTLFTNFGTIIGTPAYMSPEQAEMSGLDVDTRSDIYSLGALFYELLTGTTPFPEQLLRSVGYGEMQKIIVQQEPQRLPTRISTMEGTARSVVAKNRGAEAVNLRKRLSGDLDSIAMKCLEKDRTRRYQSASSLAADIQRHLNNEPVVARPPSKLYQVQKFVRRNRLAVTATTLLLLAIISSLIVVTTFYRSERAARGMAERSGQSESMERQRAQQEAARAEAEALRAARFQYASDMTLAQQAVDDGNLFRALKLLERHRPATGSKSVDLRGWEWRYLWNKCQTDDLRLVGWHTNGVMSVGFSPDGKTAYSGGKDGLLRTWDAATFKPKNEWRFKDVITAAAWSPDGKWIAVGVEEGRTTAVTLIDVSTGKMMQSPVPGTNTWLRPNVFVFSPDSRLLAFAGFYELFVWDIPAGKLLATLPSRTGWITPLGVDFSPDGKTMAYADSDLSDIVFWDLDSKREIRRWRGHDWYITRLFFIDEGQRLVSASGDRSVKVWNLATGEEEKKFTYPLAFGPSSVSSPRLSPDKKLMASAAAGGGVTISLQEIPSGREVRRLIGNTHLVQDVAISPDGTKLISGSFDGALRVADLSANPENKESRVLDKRARIGVVGPYGLSPDGRHLLMALTNNSFTIWTLPELTESAPRPIPVPDPIFMGLSKGAELAAFVDKSGQMVTWEGKSGRTNIFAVRLVDGVARPFFSEDGKTLAVGSLAEIDVLNLVTGTRQTLAVPAPGATLMSLELSPDGRKILTGFFDGSVKGWDIAKPSEPRIFSRHNWQVNGLAFMPDGERIISVAREIVFWNFATGAEVESLQPRPAMFRSVAVSPDSQRLAVGSADGLITIWDLASKQEVSTLSGHAKPILALKFLPDGNSLISLSVDELRVWRAPALAAAEPSR